MTMIIETNSSKYSFNANNTQQDFRYLCKNNDDSHKRLSMEYIRENFSDGFTKRVMNSWTSEEYSVNNNSEIERPQ